MKRRPANIRQGVLFSRSSQPPGRISRSLPQLLPGVQSQFCRDYPSCGRPFSGDLSQIVPLSILNESSIGALTTRTPLRTERLATSLKPADKGQKRFWIGHIAPIGNRNGLHGCCDRDRCVIRAVCDAKVRPPDFVVRTRLTTKNCPMISNVERH